MNGVPVPVLEVSAAQKALDLARRTAERIDGLFEEIAELAGEDTATAALEEAVTSLEWAEEQYRTAIGAATSLPRG